MKKNKKKAKLPLFEKAVASWLRYDPFVKVAVRNADEIRRDVMLNILGKSAAIRHFGKFPPRRPDYGPIYPSQVRETTEEALKNLKRRTQLIKKMIFWATDPGVNDRYIKSHLTRIQIVSSLLGPIFIHATVEQEKLILDGLKYMLAQKQTVLDVRGEQSFEVHEAVLEKVSDLLIHNQKVIISKAIGEAEEKMRVHLLKQIQELKGKKQTAIYSVPEMQGLARHKIVKEKFPLRKETVKQLEDILRFYMESKWPRLRLSVKQSYDVIRKIRRPLTLTSESFSR